MKSVFFTAIILIMIMIGSTLSFAQSVGINSDGSSPDASSMLDVKSTAKGLLVPRMTAVQRAAITTPATGLIVYQTDGTAGFYYNAGTPGSPSWVILLNGTTSNVTSQGNTFNGASQLLQLNGSGKVPVSNLGTGTPDGTKFLRDDGSWDAPSSGGSVSVAILRDEKSSGTNGGAYPSTGWITRDLNTELADPDNIVSLSDNEFTLAAGSYLIEVFSPFGQLYNFGKIKIRNITDNSDLVLGQSSYSVGNESLLTVICYFTISSDKTYAIQFSSPAFQEMTWALGGASGLGTEVYTQVKIVKF